MTPDVWVEVDLAALRHNLAQVRARVGDGVGIMAVVKANGYGHGYAETAKAFIEAGATALAVTRLEEALVLRDAGIAAPVLLFAPVQPENLDEALAADLQLTVANAAMAEDISSAAARLDKTAQVHIKIDTGMGRLGVLPDAADRLFRRLADLPALQVAGTYTHFSSAAQPDIGDARRQLRRFEDICAQLAGGRLTCGIRHCANSAALLRIPESHLDMVRPGTLLYGQYPSESVPRSLDLRDTWQLKARICDVRSLPAGAHVGYGGQTVLRRATRAAVLPLGFADGFTLAAEGPLYRQSALRFAVQRARRKPAVRLNGVRVQVLGRVAMQMVVIDVTDAGDVGIGDEVVVPAMRIPTSPLIPRVYVESSPG